MQRCTPISLRLFISDLYIVHVPLNEEVLFSLLSFGYITQRSVVNSLLKPLGAQGCDTVLTAIYSDVNTLVVDVVINSLVPHLLLKMLIASISILFVGKLGLQSVLPVGEGDRHTLPNLLVFLVHISITGSPWS
jgi:hypothetical protein